MTTKKEITFETLAAINVTAYTKKKGNLTYLSWANAWEIFKKNCPDATYEVKKNAEGLPYFADALGIMVYTSVTVGGQTYEMWLPVMDSANRTMKTESYRVIKYDRNGREMPVTIPAATMMDVNKAVMRCLTKNLAMFGLGLHVYEDEDLTMDELKSQQQEVRKESLAAVKKADYMTVARIGSTTPESDREMRNALLDRLQEIVSHTSTEKELNDIYRHNSWARIYPDLVDWCKARKTELKQNNVA